MTQYIYRVARCGDYVGANRAKVFASMLDNMQWATAGGERLHAHQQIADAVASGLLAEEQGEVLYQTIGYR